jgi:hypothetical protein
MTQGLVNANQAPDTFELEENIDLVHVVVFYDGEITVKIASPWVA